MITSPGRKQRELSLACGEHVIFIDQKGVRHQGVLEQVIYVEDPSIVDDWSINGYTLSEMFSTDGVSLDFDHSMLIIQAPKVETLRPEFFGPKSSWNWPMLYWRPESKVRASRWA